MWVDPGGVHRDRVHVDQRTLMAAAATLVRDCRPDSASAVAERTKLISLAKAIPAIKPRRGPPHRKPGKLHADKVYDHAEPRTWIRRRGIHVRIARKGLAVRPPPTHHPIRAPRQPARLPHPRRRHHRYKKLHKATT